MTLLQALERGIPSRIRSRGGEYFRRGAVQYIELKEHTVRAVVEGSDTYEVRIEFAGRGEIRFRCTCPDYDDHFEICKHVWAIA